MTPATWSSAGRSASRQAVMGQRLFEPVPGVAGGGPGLLPAERRLAAGLLPAAVQLRLGFAPVPPRVPAERLPAVAIGGLVIAVRTALFDIGPHGEVARPEGVLVGGVDRLGHGLAGQPADHDTGHRADGSPDRPGRGTDRGPDQPGADGSDPHANR